MSLIACFADINVSQGSVATDARCGGIFNIHLTTTLPRNLPLNFFNRLIFDRIIVVSLWPTFLAYPVYIKTTALHKIPQSTFRFLEVGLKVKGKGSPYSITERRVPELILVLGSQRAGDVSHKPSGWLPLLSELKVAYRSSFLFWLTT